MEIDFVEFQCLCVQVQIFLVGIFLAGRIGDTGAFSQKFNGFRATHIACLFYKGQGVSASFAGETVVHLLFLTDGKGRGVFFMERAESHVVLAPFPERGLLPDQLDDVGGGEYMVETAFLMLHIIT